MMGDQGETPAGLNKRMTKKIFNMKNFSETAKDPDWLNVHKKKLEAEQKLEEIREEEAQLRRIEERLEKARRRQKESKQSFGKSRTGKRRIHGGEEESNEQENILESAKIEGQNKEDVVSHKNKLN